MTARRIAKRTAVTTAVAATVAGAGLGIAGASIPDGSGVVHGCYPTSGALKPMYLIDTATQPNCPAGYSEIRLNNQPGPQGAQGAQGATGAQGPQGAKGTTGPLYAVAVDGPVDNSGGADQIVTVASLALPSGSYAVNAKIVALRTVLSGGATCDLATPQGSLDEGEAESNNTIPLEAATTGGVTISVTCFGTSRLGYIKLNAIKIGSINP